MDIPVVSIVGHSNSGKTTLVVKLVAELSQRGYRVATIKHAEELDLVRGKDSDRHLQAGSRFAAVVSPEYMVIVKPATHQATIEEVKQHMDDNYDIILCEGYKYADVPKIEAHLKCAKKRLEGIKGLVAIVTEEPVETPLRQFSFDDIGAVADFVVSKFIKSC